MDRIERMAIFGDEPEFLAEVALPVGASGGPGLAKILRHRAMVAVDEFDRAAAEIQNSADLTDSGKAKHLARAVKDYQVRLGEMEDNGKALVRELEQARARCKTSQPDQTVLAAIWPELPKDGLALKVLYQNCLNQSDFLTIAAIETFPVAFGDGVPADDLAELKRERLAVEMPDAFAALVAAEATAEAADRALQAARQHLDDVGRDLPDPDHDTGQTVGDDGIVTLTPSQAQEARA